ncbi:uncharacterized protein LOC143283954 [Babylonia areolata]|uniref:uncharacterized protein LOC143283954 n=1 Tax=Babylonia areolata TaxID=304850 RepID=UPI003FD51546
MPTLRRSKSLNDKASRQKQRASDVVRDPRTSEDGGGGGGGGGGGRTRTRTCLDNYQLLVHLRKQTDDKSRQLELAYTYGSNAHTFLRSGELQRGPESRPSSVFYPSPVSTAAAKPAAGERGCQSDASGCPAPVAAAAHCRQSSAEECSGQSQRRVGNRQENLSESWPLQEDKVGSQQQAQRCPRPVSMFEPRVRGPLEDRGRQEQIIDNLMESQKFVNSHNAKLLSKIDQLESENARLKDILTAYNIPHATLPRDLKAGPQKDVTSPHDVTGSSGSEMFPKFTSTLISPISETSVSGYGSLAGSAYGEGYPAATLEAGGRRARRIEEDTGASAEAVADYNDDTLPLSEMSVERVDSADSTLPSTLSSGRDSRVPTLNRESDKVDLESLSEKLDQVLVLQQHRGSDRKRRIAELEQRVLELTEQRKAVLERYKLIVDENEKIQRRDEQVKEELRTLLQRHGETLQQVMRSGLQHLHHELQGLGQDVSGQLDAVLEVLASSSSSSSASSSSSSSCPNRQRVGEDRAVVMDSDVKEVMDKIVDLIGPEYVRLGRRLHVPVLELELIEKGREDFAEKTRRVLQIWLRRHWEEQEEEEEGEREREGRDPLGRRVAPAQVLTQALRDIDKDIRLFNHPPISEPERRALRGCLQCAIDHVDRPVAVLDHLIALKELTPAGITFVQEVVGESRERALCRLWHVTEYRGSGVISRLALALERAGHPHVSRLLTEELAIQNARVHSRFHPLEEEEEEEDVDAPQHAASVAAQQLGSRPSPPNLGMSRPKSGSTRTRPELASKAVGLPVRPVFYLERNTAPAARQGDSGDIVWDRRVPAGANSSAAASPRPFVLKPGTRVSKV